MRAQQEFTDLSTAMETNDPAKVAMCIRTILLKRLEDEMFQLNQIATKRSGARGATARTEALAAEDSVSKARGSIDDPISESESADAYQKAMFMQEELHSFLELYDHFAAQSKVQKILVGLGFSEDWINGPIGNLSGGWKMRVSLAQALFMEPDLLLLDEPTNHLDLPAIFWLQQYLQALSNVTLVVVSHDKTFLDTVVDELIIMKNQKLEYFPGNYEEYVSNQNDKLKNNEKVLTALEKKRTHIEKSIQESLKQAKSKGDDKKLSQVASRRKKLDERFGLERSASGHRFKLNQDMVGYFLNNRAEVEVMKPDAPVRWKFPVPEKLRHHGPLLQLEAVSFQYAPGKQILKNVTMNITAGDKIGIVGANGDGKSTLMQIMIGQLNPQKGLVIHHPQAKIGYFSQNHVDEITAHEPCTTLQYIGQKLPGASEKNIRGHFGGFGIGGDLMNQEIAKLSGGQAVRLATALAVWGNPHLLILDEPTNHLDMDTITAVIDAISQFQGAVVVVSHDQHLIEKTCKDVYLLKDQNVRRLENGIKDYIKLLKASKKL